MASIGSLTANLGLESAAFINNLSRSADAMAKSAGQMDQTSKRMQGGFDRVSGAVSAAQRAIVAIGSAYVVRALGNATSAAIQMADELGKTSSRVGVSVEQLQNLQFAAERTGGSAAQMTDALERFNRNIGNAAEKGGKFANRLASMGIELRDLEGNIRPTAELFAEYADAVAGMGSQQEKAAATQEAFGRASSDLLNLLGAGSQGLAAYSEELDGLGRITSDQAKAAAEAQDAITNLSKAWDAATSEVLVAAAPLLTDLAAGLTSLIGYFRDLPEPVQKFGGALAAVAAGVAALSPVLLPLAAGIAFLSAPVLAVVAAIVGTAGLVFAIWTFRDEIAGALTGAVSSALGLFTDLRDGAIAAVQGLVEGIRGALGSPLAAALDAVRGPVDAFIGIWEGAKNIIVGNSIVPDMIDDIGAEFARLDELMVLPTERSTQAVTRAFARIEAPSTQVERMGGAVRGLGADWESMGQDATRALSSMFQATAADFSTWKDNLSRGLTQLTAQFGQMLGGTLGGPLGGIAGGVLGGLGTNLVGRALGRLFGGGGRPSRVGLSVGGGAGGAFGLSDLTGIAGLGGTAGGGVQREMAAAITSFDQQMAGVLSGRQALLASQALEGANQTARFRYFDIAREGADILVQRAREIVGSLIEGIDVGAVMAGVGRDVGAAQARVAAVARIADFVSPLSAPAKAAADAVGGLIVSFRAMTEQAKAFGIPLGQLDAGFARARAALEESLLAPLQEKIRQQANQMRSFFDGLLGPIEGLLAQLRIGPLSAMSPQQQFQASQEEFRRLAGLAQAGDLGAIQQIAQAGQVFLQQAQQQFASGQGFTDAFREVNSVLGGLQDELRRQREQETAGLPTAGDEMIADEVRRLREEIQATRDIERDILRELQRLSSVRAA